MRTLIAIRWAVLVTSTTLLVSGCKLTEGYAEARSARIGAYEQKGAPAETLGAARFVFDDVGALNTRTLQTNAMPWKVVTTALVMEYAARNGKQPKPLLLKEVLQQYGWITPDGIDNWPDKIPPAFDRPIGMVSGEIRNAVPRVRLEIANIGCAACHAGMSYDSSGNPTGRVWLGSPNTSRYFDGYLNAIVSALRYVKSRNEELLATIPIVHPNVHKDELTTIRKRVLPQINERLQQAERGDEILIAFGHGAPGLTNGIAALKLRLNAKPSLVSDHEYGYASIPDLYGRWMRSSVLYDGLYALRADQRFALRSADHRRDERERRQFASIVAFFIVPSTGVAADLTERQAKRIDDMVTFLNSYRPQPYPGPVDRQRAERGAALYAARCASCHGAYSPGADSPRLQNYPNKLVAQDEINSDPERWRAITDNMVRVLNETVVAKKINAANAKGYVAPILNGLWASAPYMHNGSVPTLWHFMRPEQRPKRFMVGGHKLDFDKVGIAGSVAADGVYRYPEGYRAWSLSTIYDVSEIGKGNAGHEKEFGDLKDHEKDELLEYLKLI